MSALPLPTLGVDLLSDETALRAGVVRRAENVDIDRSGRFRRRAGYTLRTAGHGYSSLYSCARGTFLVRGSTLYHLDPSSLTQTALCALGGEARADFHEYNGHLYVITPDSFWWSPAGTFSFRPVGVPLPSRLPRPVAVSTGSLTAGKYGVAISCLDDRGEESRTQLLGVVELTSSGGIRLEQLVLTAGVTYRVYITPANGDVLYLAAEFPATFSTYFIGDAPDGAQRATQQLEPMPAGTFVRGHAGRLYVAHDDILYFSQPLRPHLRDPRHDFIQFVGRISLVESVEGGLLVGDARGVWFLPGNDPTKFELRSVSTSAAVFRSSTTLPGAHFDLEVSNGADAVAVWLSVDGYMLARPDGTVVPLHPDRVRVPADAEGKTVFLIRDGVKQLHTLIAASSTQTPGVALDTSVQ